MSVDEGTDEKKTNPTFDSGGICSSDLLYCAF
jgi:hypothetical protein